MPLEVAHTAQLEAADLVAVRTLLDVAFAGDIDDTDVEHTLGGVHALVHSDGQLVAHGAVVQRQFRHGGRGLRVLVHLSRMGAARAPGGWR